MKDIKNFIGLFLSLSISLLFISCNKDDDSEMVRNNATGQIIFTWGNDYDYDIQNVSLWINNSAILFWTDGMDKEVDWNGVHDKDYFPFYNFNMNKAYELISDLYDVNVNGSTSEDEIPGEVTLMIREVKALKDYYQYIAEMRGGIVVFKRISTENYN